MELNYKLENLIKRYKDKVFIKDLTKKKEISYNEFYQNSLYLHNYFKSKKIKEGSRIMIHMNNSLEYLYVLFACLIGNYVACPVDTEIKKKKLKQLEKILRPSIKIKKEKDVKFLKFPSIVTEKKVPYILIFSSGTTGEPKGIQISNYSYIKSAISFSKLVNYDEQSNILHILPMYYNAGILNTFYSCFFAGSQITLAKKISALNIFFFWDNILKENITSFHLTPEIANALTKLKVSNNLKNKISKIKIISTGSFIHQNIVDEFEKIYGVRILSCYGTTEIGGPITIQSWENSFVEGSVGYHSKEIKIKILKKRGIKYVYVKSPYLMDCYINSKGKKIIPKLKNGFFKTGDIGEYKKKELLILGRRKDVIKKGSEIISLPYIENVAMKSKIIEDIASVSKYDLAKGSKVFIFVKFKKNKDLTAAINDLNKHFFKNLKKIEIPDKIIPVPLIPKTFNGKPKKQVLEQTYL